MHAFYDKVTDRARAALDIGNLYAKNNKNPLVTPLHVLYGILEEDKNIAVVIMKNLGVDTKMLKAQVIQAIGKGKYQSNDIAVPYSREVCRLMCIAIDYGLEVKHIACQHLLKALMAHDDEIPYILLSKHGVTLDLVDAAVRACVKKVA